MSEADLFAVFGEPRRPWLDPERLREKFQGLTRTEHPDQQRSPDAEAHFSLLNQAQATLTDHRARLRHLIGLEFPDIKLSGPAEVPVGYADLFVEVNGVLGEGAGFMARKAQAASALAKALLAREEYAQIEKCEACLTRLNGLQEEVIAQLRDLDAVWTSPAPRESISPLLAVYQRFAYLSRWIEQLREQLFTLAA